MTFEMTFDYSPENLRRIKKILDRVEKTMRMDLCPIHLPTGFKIDVPTFGRCGDIFIKEPK